MKNTMNVKLAAFVLTAGMILFATGLWMLVTPASGSTIMGNDYQSTTTRSTSSNTHWMAKIASLGGCTLGSVVIASTTSAGGFQLRDATSTTDVSSTTIVTFEPSATEGTYTFDIVCNRGLSVVTPANFQGEYVVTYR